MKQRYEVLLREVPAHVKQMEVIECDYVVYDNYALEFRNEEGETLVLLNWQDVIKVTKLN